ncbi:GMC oxidoreductase [Bacillus salipaludis]|uniref:GMC oxidoreductase n=1 Tax=Bacillus salipaludis TaxID=2547811 RepID=UPI002E1C7B25
MAPLNMGGVVNSFGRVNGVNKLIVTDAQIIPFTVDGNTSAAVILIGYTIANYIIQEGNLKIGAKSLVK